MASRYRTWPYDRLVEELLDMPTIAEVAGKSGASYQVEVEGFWHSGRPGDLRVMVAVDDGPEELAGGCDGGRRPWRSSPTST